ncbi:phage baseplate protein [Escherichia coli]|nr:phage baseplate protein [Escherichia coli]
MTARYLGMNRSDGLTVTDLEQYQPEYRRYPAHTGRLTGDAS